MVQGYYTLPEAAHVLGMTPEELKQMAQKGQIRSFQDRGTWRFRMQDVQELARQRGSTSDPDLVLGEAHTPTKPGSPRSPKKSDPSVFDFPLDAGEEKVDVGQEMLVMDTPGATPTGGRKSGAKSDPKKTGARSPTPGSDSDVRLVNEAEMAGSDSDVKLVGQDSDIRMSPEGGPRSPHSPRVTVQRKPGSPPPSPLHSPPPKKPESGPKKIIRPPSTAQAADSGVRLVPMESDSDVKIVPAGSDEVSLGDQPPPSATDSDIRIEELHMPASPRPRQDAGMLTDEIDLDAEIRKQDQAQKKAGPTKVKRKSGLQFPTTSPFELSESDVDSPTTGQPAQAKKKGDSSSDFDLAPAKKKKKSDSDSSDFDLVPAKESSSPVDSDSDDFSLQMPDESALGGEEVGLKGPTSGISLDNPVDAGISLESDKSGIDFDLSLQAEATPKPSPAPLDSDSEFELSLDADDSSGQHAAAPAPEDSSSSEFELTLDDSSSGLSPLADDDSPQAKGGAAEKDIFETDFEVPALEEDSGSQVAALDTDLDSSDFDIALDDSATEDESGSQVVTLDEEAEEGAATLAARRQVAGLDEEEVEGDETAMGAGAVREVVREKLIEPAPWGPLPVAFMLPCVIVMFFVGLLGFELIQTSTGYKAPGVITRLVGDLMGQKIR